MPWKPAGQANRCPLCHKDIGAGERGWRQHLKSKKCFANVRNNPLPPPEIVEDSEEKTQEPIEVPKLKKIEAIAEENEYALPDD